MTQERFYRDDEPLTPEDQARVDAAWEIHKAAQPCAIPPEGWSCSRTAGHDGPCAATPKSSEGELLSELEKLRDRYKSQMKFCDIEPLPYFRDFASQLEVIISKVGKAKS